MCVINLTTVIAYLDPGTGSFLIQILMAVLFGGLLAFKMFWSNIKSFFTKSSSKETDQDAGETDQVSKETNQEPDEK